MIKKIENKEKDVNKDYKVKICLQISSLSLYIEKRIKLTKIAGKKNLYIRESHGALIPKRIDIAGAINLIIVGRAIAYNETWLDTMAGRRFIRDRIYPILTDTVRVCMPVKLNKAWP